MGDMAVVDVVCVVRWAGATGRPMWGFASMMPTGAQPLEFQTWTYLGGDQRPGWSGTPQDRLPEVA